MTCIFHVTISLTRAIQQIRSAAQYNHARCTCLSYLPISTHPSPELLRVCFLLLFFFFFLRLQLLAVQNSLEGSTTPLHTACHAHTHIHTHKYNRLHHHFQRVQPQDLLTNLIWHVSTIFYSTLYRCTSLQRNVHECVRFNGIDTWYFLFLSILSF